MGPPTLRNAYDTAAHRRNTARESYYAGCVLHMGCGPIRATGTGCPLMLLPQRDDTPADLPKRLADLACGARHCGSANNAKPKRSNGSSTTPRPPQRDSSSRA